MINIIQTADMLLSLTKSGTIEWEHSDDIPCLTTTYGHKNYIVCKVEDDNGKKFVSLNLLDKNQNEIGDFNNWEEEEENYTIIEKLYNAANEKSHQIA